MALRWELIFHSLSDFLCPLFSEKDKRRRPPPCSHSCGDSGARTGPDSIDRRHSSWLFPPPINPFFLEESDTSEWHICCRMLTLGAAVSAGVLCCRDTVVVLQLYCCSV